MSHPPGTRIRFPRTIIEPACGDHPEFLMAAAGDMGEVVSCDRGLPFPYSVKWDGWPHAFGAEEADFEVIEAGDVPFKHREPALFEAFRAYQRAINNVVQTGRRFNG